VTNINLYTLPEEFRVVFRFLTYIYLWVNSRSCHGSTRSRGNNTRDLRFDDVNCDVSRFPRDQIAEETASPLVLVSVMSVDVSDFGLLSIYSVASLTKL